MTPIFASERLDWSSAVGLFLINFGTLDHEVFAFLESQLSLSQFTKIKRLHFHERIARIKTLVSRSRRAAKHKQAFREFFQRLDPIRELRNHIAHGHMLISVAKDGQSSSITLSLPKDIYAAHASTSRHLEFSELLSALAELTGLIEEFERLSGPWMN